jgi:hypothetical protein
MLKNAHNKNSIKSMHQTRIILYLIAEDKEKLCEIRYLPICSQSFVPSFISVHAIPESNTKYKKILVIAQQPNQPDLFP